jgi:hypothetical protein
VDGVLPVKWGYTDGASRIDSASSRPLLKISGPLANCDELDGSGPDTVATFDPPDAFLLRYDAATRTWQRNVDLTKAPFVPDRCYLFQIVDPVTAVLSPAFPIKTK